MPTILNIQVLFSINQAHPGTNSDAMADKKSVHSKSYNIDIKTPNSISMTSINVIGTFWLKISTRINHTCVCSYHSISSMYQIRLQEPINGTTK